MNSEQFSRVQQAYDRQEPETFDAAVCLNCRELFSAHVETRDEDIDYYVCPDNSGSEYEELTDEMMAEEAAEQRMAERYGR